MKEIIGKIIILLLCLTITLQMQFSFTVLVTAILISIIISLVWELPAIFPSERQQQNFSALFPIVTSSAFAILSCFFSVFIFFIPLVAFDLGKKRNIPATLLCIFSLVLSLWRYPISIILALFLGSCFTAYTGLICKKNELSRKNLQKEQDEKYEAELMVRRKFRELSIVQDENITTATLKERNRIAREIHDNVGHMLTRSILQAGAIGVINKDENLKEPLAELKSSLDLAMNNIRSSVHDLHDESVNLHSSLQKLIEGIDDFEVNFRYDIKGDVQKDIKYAFIAITKEAITNSEKYSNGKKIDILLREHPAFYQLSISDDGTNSNISGKGIGLLNMQDRVDALGGILQISTEHGFHINVTIMKD